MSNRWWMAIVLWALIVWIFVLLISNQRHDRAVVAIITQDAHTILPLPVFTNVSDRYILTSDDLILWTGRKIGWSHNGSIDIVQWWIAIDADGTIGGRFVISMDSIVIYDMSQDNPMYTQLLQHLRNGFFNVEQYPTAVFDIKKMDRQSGDRYIVVWNLQLHGITNEITFPAVVTFFDDAMRVQTTFSFDRTARGIQEVIQIVDKYIELGIDITLNRR